MPPPPPPSGASLEEGGGSFGVDGVAVKDGMDEYELELVVSEEWAQRFRKTLARKAAEEKREKRLRKQQRKSEKRKEALEPHDRFGAGLSLLSERQSRLVDLHGEEAAGALLRAEADLDARFDAQRGNSAPVWPQMPVAERT